MRRILWLLLVAVLICACDQTPVAELPTSPPSPPTAAPTTAIDESTPIAAAPTSIPPTTAPTTEGDRSTPTAAAPTGVPPTIAAGAPTLAAEPSAAPTPEPAAPQLNAPLNPQDQAAALLPDFQGDLANADKWNRYTISAMIDPAADMIAGREQIEYTNRDDRPLDAVYFHLYPNLPDFGGQLRIDAVAIDGRAAEVVYESRRYLLRVNLPQPLAPGAKTVIGLAFTTNTPKNASASLYGAFNEENGVLALASSYPIAAIVRGGTWDIAQPNGRGDFVNSETALYDVTLAAPADWNLITTGVAVDRRLEDGHQTVRIVSGPQRDFMISATQLAHVSAEVDGTRINSYYEPGSEAGGQGALQSAVNALRTYNARYGRYPLAELDVVQIAATTFLGVEYPGLIMIERRLYTRPPALEDTVAHEVSHQWWYSQVGNDVQTEAWIDEALASYSQIVYQEVIHGPDAAERELEGFRQRYRDLVAAGGDAPVEQPTAAFRNNYVAVVYGKAVLFFQALRKQIGDTAFDRFLHDYYANHRYGFVTGADLLASAEGACSCNLDELYRDWITTVTPLEVP